VSPACRKASWQVFNLFDDRVHCQRWIVKMPTGTESKAHQPSKRCGSPRWKQRQARFRENSLEGHNAQEGKGSEPVKRFMAHPQCGTTR